MLNPNGRSDILSVSEEALLSPMKEDFFSLETSDVLAPMYT